MCVGGHLTSKSVILQGTLVSHLKLVMLKDLLNFINYYYVNILGLRVKDMVLAGKLAICAVILHNLAVHHGDNGDAFENEAQLPSRREPTVPEGDNQVGPARERRRNEIVRYFTR